MNRIAEQITLTDELGGVFNSFDLFKSLKSSSGALEHVHEDGVSGASRGAVEGALEVQLHSLLGVDGDAGNGSCEVDIFVDVDVSVEDEVKVEGLRQRGVVEGDLGQVSIHSIEEHLIGIIGEGVADGAQLLLDGRGVKVPGFEKGNFVGPTILMNVDAKNRAYTEEIFGPVLVALAVDTLEDAIKFTNESKYGNGCAIFTQSGSVARKYQHEIDVGQVGINVPIPVPLPYFSFTGSRGSIQGDIHFYGRQGVQFYTQIKTVTSNWDYKPSPSTLSMSMPTLGGANTPKK